MQDYGGFLDFTGSYGTDCSSDILFRDSKKFVADRNRT